MLTFVAAHVAARVRVVAFLAVVDAVFLHPVVADFIATIEAARDSTAPLRIVLVQNDRNAARTEAAVLLVFFIFHGIYVRSVVRLRQALPTTPDPYTLVRGMCDRCPGGWDPL